MAIDPTSLTPEEHRRFLAIHDNVGKRHCEIAAILGLGSAALSLWLRRRGLSWPISPSRVDAMLALPVVTFAARAEAVKAEERRTPLPFIATNDGDPHLTLEEVARRRLAARTARLMHELGWLEKEQRRYGLARMGRPLSRMPL